MTQAQCEALIRQVLPPKGAAAPATSAKAAAKAANKAPAKAARKRAAA
jgi:hypothetical protein